MQRVQKRGLPGDHHFYITFDTTAPGAILSKRLKDQYPEEMTVVLQYQFWDMLVYDDRFEVKLSFNTIPERLVVPFAAIKSFVDPSVPFGFSPTLFAPAAAAAAREDASGEPPPTSAEGQDLAALPSPTSVPSITKRQQPPAAEITDVETVDVDEADENHDNDSAKVVELDLFRKK
jgi:hypothetical protein